jgi:hypothetical protein
LAETLFVLAFFAFSLCVRLNQAMHGRPGATPLNPTLLHIAWLISTLSAIALFVAGFFLFPWWLPLSALAIAAIFGVFIAGPALNSGNGPAVAVFSALAGIALSVSSFILRR